MEKLTPSALPFSGAASTNAADQPISAADLRPDGMTEGDAELARAEAKRNGFDCSAPSTVG